MRERRRRFSRSLVTPLINRAISASDLEPHAGAAPADAEAVGSTSMRMMLWFLSSTTQIAPSAATVIPTGAPCGRTPGAAYHCETSSVNGADGTSPSFSVRKAAVGAQLTL